MAVTLRTQMSHADNVLQILAEVAETDEVRSNPNLRLYETQVLDSLATVELIVRLSAAFSIDISPAEFDRAAWATPVLIIEDVERRLQQCTSSR